MREFPIPFPRFDNFVQMREKLLKLLQIITKIFAPRWNERKFSKIARKAVESSNWRKTRRFNSIRPRLSRDWLAMQVSFTSSSYFHPSFSLPRFFSPPPCDKQISIEARKFQIPNSNPSFLQEYNTLEKRRRNKNKNNNNNNSSSRSRKKEDRNFAFHSRARTLVPEFYSSSLTSPLPSSTRPVAFVREENSRKRKKKRRKPAIESVQFLSRFLKRDYFRVEEGKQVGNRSKCIWKRMREEKRIIGRPCMHVRIYKYAQRASGGCAAKRGSSVWPPFPSWTFTFWSRESSDSVSKVVVPLLPYPFPSPKSIRHSRIHPCNE